jgi:hypothetical protein
VKVVQASVRCAFSSDGSAPLKRAGRRSGDGQSEEMLECSSPESRF